jgi:hypothetical protein
LTYVRAGCREGHDGLEDICRDVGGVYKIGEGNGDLKDWGDMEVDGGFVETGVRLFRLR